MIIQGHTLREMAEFIEGRILGDGIVELKEKEGCQIRVTRYPSILDKNAQPEIFLLRADD